LRCGRCGNENAETNRFCGMCGASLIATAVAGGQTRGQAPTAPSGNAVATKQAVVPTQPVPQAPIASRDVRPSREPVITGPSFLGLSTPGPDVNHPEEHPVGHPADRDAEVSGRDTAPQADAGHGALRPSSNLDYLLEDEEAAKRDGGKLLLVMAALALAVGFGYLHWKHGGFDWLDAGDKKPAAAAKQSSEAGQSGTDAAGAVAAPEGATPAAGTGGTTPTSGSATAPTETGAPSATSAPATSTPAPLAAGSTTISPTASPAASSAPSSTASSAPSSTPQATASQDASPTSSSATPSATTSSQTVPSRNASSPTQAADPNLPAGSAPPAVSSDSGQQPPVAAPAAASRPARKPSPARAVVAKPVDAVADAERYIYGRGVGQDCDRGLRLLKAPAQQSNAKAMISLGTLYSTGTCTPRDLPTAYRWFALALHQDPDNLALQNDLQKLWGQMTQPERQLAIKLSQ
jgi:hypothetical protein